MGSNVSSVTEERGQHLGITCQFKHGSRIIKNRKSNRIVTITSISRTLRLYNNSNISSLPQQASNVLPLLILEGILEKLDSGRMVQTFGFWMIGWLDSGCFNSGRLDPGPWTHEFFSIFGGMCLSSYYLMENL